MADAADKAAEDEARAMALFEEQRQARIAESMRPYDPEAPINCLDCGEEVSIERQRAYPHTRRCTRCAAEVQKGYRDRWPA